MGVQRWRRPRPTTAIGVAGSLVVGLLTAQGLAGPAAAADGLTLSVDVSAARHAISPDIYGMNGGDPAFVAETRHAGGALGR